MKRALSLIGIILLILSLCACAVRTTEAPEKPLPNKLAKIVVDSGIVIPKDASENVTAAADAIADAAKAAFGADIKVSLSAEDAGPALYIGTQECLAAAEKLTYGDFAIELSDGDECAYIASYFDRDYPAAAAKAIELLDRSDADSELPYYYRCPEATFDLKIATFNIQAGGGVGYNFKTIADDITSLGLDIVGLQEVDMMTGRNHRQDTLAKLSQHTGYEYYGFSKCIDYDGGEYGTAILSRYPIVSYETTLLDSRGHEQRAVGHAVIEIDGVRFDFFNTHLIVYNQTVHRLQSKQLGEMVSACPTAILTGDFNETSPKKYMQFLPEGSVYANGADEPFITNPDGPIDNIVATPGSVISNVTMENGVSHSDHYMLHADVRITVKK